MHINDAAPRIFPGIVHERTRRGSLSQGRSSEKDVEGTAVTEMETTKFGNRDRNGQLLDVAVAEEEEGEADEKGPT